MKNIALCLVLAACGPLPVAEDDETVEDEVATSIFRNNLRRVNLQPQALGQAVIDVSTEDEFRAALTSLPAVTGDCYGRGIRVVVPTLVVTDGFTLGVQHAGLSIKSSTTTTISVASTATPTTSAFFVVPFGADEVKISGFSWTSTPINTLVNDASRLLDVSGCSSDDASTFLLAVSNGAQSSSAVVNANRTEGNLFTTSGTGLFSRTMATSNLSSGFTATVSNSTINGNVFTGNLGVTGDTNMFVGNRATGTITFTGQYNVINGNHCGGGTINTATGGGLNAVVGNTGVSSLVNDITDAVGLNTT